MHQPVTPLRSRRSCLLWALIPLFPFVAQAQRRVVRGVVTDQRGTPLKGASIRLRDLQTLGIRSYISDKDGAYQFYGLNPNFVYEVRAVYDGVFSKTVRLDYFESSPEVVVNLEIVIRQ